MARTEPELVLRNPLFQAEAAHIVRRGSPALDVVAASAPEASPHPPAGTRDALLEEALMQARAEGLRQGHEEGLRTGYEEGMRKGEAAALAAGRATVDKAVAAAAVQVREREEQLIALMAQLGEQQAPWRSAIEDDAVALVYELACRVFGTALLSVDGIRAQAHELLAQSREEAPAFHVHPTDFALLQAHELAGSTVRWVADGNVELGGCMVQGKLGALDARLETILDQCRQALLEARARRATPAAGKAS